MMFSGGSKGNVGKKEINEHQVKISFLLNIPFWFPWKHQKTKDFLMLLGESKGNIRKKRVNQYPVNVSLLYP